MGQLRGKTGGRRGWLLGDESGIQNLGCNYNDVSLPLGLKIMRWGQSCRLKDLRNARSDYDDNVL